MTDLKKKILTILIAILSTFIISVVLIFNISIYNKEYNELKDKLIRVSDLNKQFYSNDRENHNPLFYENEVYEVTLDNQKNVVNVFTYSENKMTNEEIQDLINKNSKNINNNKIGLLYTNKYIFSKNNKENLIILNNENSQKYLKAILIKSLIILIILEILIVVGSLKITKWIVKPVSEAFLKQKQFIYDASHELKTPIAIIRASAETLENNLTEKKWLENIKSENERMNKLVVNLLELSKSENIKETEIYNSVNLSKLIEKKAYSFESLIYENNLKLETKITKDIMFKCSEDRIKELLAILLDNAIKHGKKKSVITVSLFKEKNNIVLSVQNEGEEIPVLERKKIFERFYRIDKSRNRDENRYGLGLSIAKNIVNNHNGNILVDCKNGYTTFTVIFKQN